MVAPPRLPDESARLKALDTLEILDSEFEKDYDELCQLAADVCETPIALISFVGQDRQWFKAAVGLSVRETHRDFSFCAHAIGDDQLFEIPDAAVDDRFADNPLVTGDPQIRFYAGKPLITSDGHALGTLCALDRVPRRLQPRQKRALETLAKQVVTQLELRKALVKLERLNDDKSRFLSIIAHDLRSPFSALMGLSDVLLESFETLSGAEVRKMLEGIHSSIRRTYQLSENLLEWALLEQGALPFHPQRWELETLVASALEPFQESLEKKQLGCHVEVAPGLTVWGDRPMLESAVRNLVSNAIKFSRPGGAIAVRGASVSGAIRLTVADQGVGMTDAQRQGLSRGLKASTKGTQGEAGTGLGLGLVRLYTQKHQATVEITSQWGVGTEISLIVPLPPPHP